MRECHQNAALRIVHNRDVKLRGIIRRFEDAQSKLLTICLETINSDDDRRTNNFRIIIIIISKKKLIKELTTNFF